MICTILAIIMGLICLYHAINKEERRREKMKMLKIDMDITPPKDWLLLWIAKRKQMLESMGHTVERIDYFKSSKRGYHFYIRLKEDITDDWGNMLQFLCGDDQTRVKINQWRIKRKMKYWNKLFHRVLYRKKAPKALTCYYCGNKIPVPDRWFENEQENE